MSDLREKLTQNLDEAEWEWLIPHAQRDVLIVVASGLDLLDVGEAIASDNTQSVGVWIDEQLISKPSPIQLGDWNGNPTKRFNALIIEPYVLIQEKGVNGYQ
ncbi:DUF2288 domain-containing protein [Cylindrospermopsis raciborskii LB2897]|jgi:hypothetical protein|uniref:DUF2288 domain-containing protein n=1 Tax=Cylindrospermopsis raciborskii TaxID=77022 RepID=UPI001454D3DF|nr:DUF2288 domain-containing protein [Cylindrospermopsis raciborskii]MBG0743470.1 DUF2288 domain-containing protein [Cylindrospermopsis raciborskii KL1]NLQ07626.1 DUF2288 domain-containing protein [Cylindrospermopsis raciborskii LB2897]